MDLENNLPKIREGIFRAISSQERFEEYSPPGGDISQELLRLSKLFQQKPPFKEMSSGQMNIYLFNLHSLHKLFRKYRDGSWIEHGYSRTEEEVRLEFDDNFINCATNLSNETAKDHIHWAERAWTMFGSSATWLKGLEAKCITVRTLYRLKKESRDKITQWVKEANEARNSPSLSPSSLPLSSPSLSSSSWPSSPPLSPPPLSCSTGSPSSLGSPDLSPYPSPLLPLAPDPMDWESQTIFFADDPGDPYHSVFSSQQQQPSSTISEHFPGALLDSCTRDENIVYSIFPTMDDQSHIFPITLMINGQSLEWNSFHSSDCRDSSSVCWEICGAGCPLRHRYF